MFKIKNIKEIKRGDIVHLRWKDGGFLTQEVVLSENKSERITYAISHDGKTFTSNLVSAHMRRFDVYIISR